MTSPGPSESGLDEPELQAASQSVERLLAELRSSVPAATWSRIEELVSALTSIYGQGLARTLEACAGGSPLPGPVRQRLTDDALVGSLLILHGLHPCSLAERVAGALERVRRSLALDPEQLEASPIDASGRLHIQLRGDGRHGSLPAAGIESLLRRCLEEAAPDLEQLSIERLGQFAAAPPKLVQIDLSRSRSRNEREVAP